MLYLVLTPIPLTSMTSSRNLSGAKGRPVLDLLIQQELTSEEPRIFPDATMQNLEVEVGSFICYLLLWPFQVLMSWP